MNPSSVWELLLKRIFDSPKKMVRVFDCTDRLFMTVKDVRLVDKEVHILVYTTADNCKDNK